MPSLFTRFDLVLESVFLHLTQPTRHPIALSTLTDLTRSRSQLIAENALLRQQLILLQHQDKKPRFTPSQDAKGSSIEMLKTLYRAPKANAICERFLGSVRRECLDHILVVGEQHLYRVVREYVEFFNCARPHQGIEQKIPVEDQPKKNTGKIIAFPVLNGLHHNYRRVA